MGNPLEQRQKIAISALLTALMLLSACASWLPDAHKIDIIHGNAIERDDLNKIHPGMTKAEVTPILGTPLISDPFHAQRWDYIYQYLPGKGEQAQSRVTLFFEGDRLVKIDDSEYLEPVKITNADEDTPIDDEDNPENIGPKPEIIDRDKL